MWNMYNHMELSYFGLIIRFLFTDFFRIQFRIRIWIQIRNVYFNSGSVPDPAKSFGSFRIRILNTASLNCWHLWCFKHPCCCFLPLVFMICLQLLTSLLLLTTLLVREDPGTSAVAGILSNAYCCWQPLLAFLSVAMSTAVASILWLLVYLILLTFSMLLMFLLLLLANFATATTGVVNIYIGGK